MAISIAYCTSRRDPRIEWFWECLQAQLNGREVKVIVVDHYKDERDVTQGIWKTISENCKHVAPKPNVWCGKHRLTKQDYFAASNARNTAICYCSTDFIQLIDDLTVLGDHWLDAVFRASDFNGVTLGIYRKVNDVTVKDGKLDYYTNWPGGRDVRWMVATEGNADIVHDGRLIPIDGTQLFGCSFGCPIHWLLQVNGFDENCDSVGGEDYCLGIRLQNAGCKFVIDKSMMTWESNELHFVDKPFLRVDKGQSPNDKSHRLLEWAQQSTVAPNYFPGGGIRELRESILLGGSFPITQIPAHDFWDKMPLSEM